MTTPIPENSCSSTALEILNLKSRYFRLIDAKDWDAVRELCIQDLDYSHPTIGRHRTADAMLRATAEVASEIRTIHLGFDPVITQLNEDSATGSWRLQSFIYSEWGVAGTVNYAEYQDAFVRVEGSWLFSRIHLTYLYRGASG